MFRIAARANDDEETMQTTIRVLGLWLAAKAKTQRGATAIEYAVVAAGIAAMVVLAVALLGRSTNSDFVCTADSWETRTERC